MVGERWKFFLLVLKLNCYTGDKFVQQNWSKDFLHIISALPLKRVRSRENNQNIMQHWKWQHRWETILFFCSDHFVMNLCGDHRLCLIMNLCGDHRLCLIMNLCGDHRLCLIVNLCGDHRLCLIMNLCGDHRLCLIMGIYFADTFTLKGADLFQNKNTAFVDYSLVNIFQENIWKRILL